MPKVWKGLLLASVLLIFISSTVLAGGKVASDWYVDDLQPTGTASVRIIPPEGEQGSTHTIFASGLTANETVTVQILNETSGERVYSTAQLVDSTGRIEFEIFTSRSDPAGTYRVELLSQSGSVLGTGTLTILATAALESQLSISPDKAEAGSAFEINLINVRPFANLEVQIENAEGEQVFTTMARATVDGTFHFTWESEPRDGGIYTVIAFDRGAELIREVFTIDGPIYIADISVFPSPAEKGDTVLVSIIGLAPNSAVNLNILYARTLLQTLEGMTDTNGSVIFNIPTDENSLAGGYVLEVIQNELVVSQSAYRIEGETVLINVAPSVSPQDGRVAISVTGLGQGTSATLEIAQGTTIIFSREITGDANGNVIFLVNVQELLTAGDYEVRVIRDAMNLAISSLRIESAIVTPPDTNVEVRISPVSGAVGTSHLVTVIGLDAGETVGINVLFNGASVYNTTRTADATGGATVSLSSEAGDPTGTYTVQIERAGTAIASANFEVQGADVVTPPTGNVQVSINPESGAIGTSHLVTVTGLEVGETVTLNVLFNNASVYNTTRTADATGGATLSLVSEAGDSSGIYTVQVERAGTALASATFEIQGADVVTPPTDNVQVSITPSSGAIGTSHMITVTGLEVGETVTLNVLFNGTSVYSTSRTADSTGGATLSLVSEAGDAVGTYTVQVERSGMAIASGTFNVQGADVVTPPTRNVSIVIEPTSAPIGQAFTVRVMGLNASETVQIEVVFAGAAVYSTERTADTNGQIEILLTGEAGDPTGEYEVQVKQGTEVLVSADFTLEGTEVVQPPTPTPPPSSTVNITIEPNSGERGTTHDVSITGLNPNETVQVEVVLESAVVYRTERTADANGLAEVLLLTEETDPIGTYVVRVLRAGNELASADFTVEGAVVTQPTPVPTETATSGTGGRIVEGRLTMGRPSERVTFTGTAGDTVVIALSSNDFDTYLSLEDRNGNEIQSNDDSGGTLNSQIGPFTLPYTGDYTVVASSYGFMNGGGEGVVGNFRLLVEFVGLTQVDYGSTTSISLTAENFSQYLSFYGTAGDVVSIDVNSNGTIDTELSIITPEGTSDFSDDDGGAGFDPEVTRYVVATTGTYTVTLRAFTPGEIGTATVTINRYDQRTLDEQARIVRLNRKLTSDILTLYVQEGEAVQLNLSVINGQVGDLSVSVMQGATSLMYYQAAGIPNELILGFVAIESGSMTIRINDATGSTSEIEYSITRQAK